VDGRIGRESRRGLRVDPTLAEVSVLRRLSRQRGGRVIRYPIGSSGQTLVLADGVLAHFRKHRQTRPWSREAGGQLFARLAAPEICIEVATGPRPTDRQGRTYYHPTVVRNGEKSRRSIGVGFIMLATGTPTRRGSPPLQAPT